MSDWAETADSFIDLFGGTSRIRELGAFGTGRGEWIKRPLRLSDVIEHLRGDGPGVGIAPLGPQNDVMFAAIDLDEPDFEAAQEMQSYLPGVTFLERSRSGNAHVWAFFSKPIEAWVPRGLMAEAVLAAGKTGVEIFPKNHDFSKVKFGNYINLPFHGYERPIIDNVLGGGGGEMSLDTFLALAGGDRRNEPEDWRKRARWLMIGPPEARESTAEFGTRKGLHRCAEYIIEHRDDNPITEGHRAAVFFSLAKMVSHYEGFDHDEALMIMELVNESAPDPIPSSEIRRILGNAERGEFTSTGCDDPLVQPFADPSCTIANPRR